jgi:peptide chain release factor 2
MEKPDFWSDSQGAQKISQRASKLQDEINAWKQLYSRLEDAETMWQLGVEESDENLISELKIETDDLAKKVSQVEFELMFDEAHDRNNAILTIHSGQGGTESQDWAQMLMRMYLRWCESKSYKTDLIDQMSGEEAGIKSATIIVSGDYAYGYLKAEAGVHRLVRLSPFDFNHRRHTSFASVSVLPEINEEIEVEVNEKDLRVDTYRSSGAGGQHVNVTDSAVRIVHIPTGIVVQCQNERSQHKNREIAMKILRARLYEYQLNKREEELAQLRGDRREISWGSQIRSYVMHPYRLVKDLRTDIETGDVDSVLDGEIDQFIEAYLKRRRAKDEGRNK